MTVLEFEEPSMSGSTTNQTGWTDEKRHCLHILATHYPSSSWAERVAIFNQVCNDTRTANQIRDEYGGHSAGQRDRSDGRKPSRSIRWNDIVCRDEFGLAGPFNRQQQVDRGTILHNIQATIVLLGLNGSGALSTVTLVAGMAMADVSLAPGNTAAAAPPTAAPDTAASTTTLAGHTASASPAQHSTSAARSSASGPAAVSSLVGPATTAANLPSRTTTLVFSAPFQSGATASTDRVGNRGKDNEYVLRAGEEHFPAVAVDVNDMCDPEEGDAEWYHSCEIKREAPHGHWIFRAIKDLPYSEEKPVNTFLRWVHFPAIRFQQFPVQVCRVADCEVCGEFLSVELGEREGQDE